MVLGVWCCLTAFAAVASAQNTPFTFDDFISGQFSQRGFSGVWISDTEFTYTISGEPGIFVFDVSTLTNETLVEGDLLAQLDTTSPVLSADRSYILAPSDVQQVYRYSRTAQYALYNIATQNTRNIQNHDRLQLCIFGGGHSLAYVYENNLYYLPENAEEAIQLTTDGVTGVIYNGHTDWVYEEDVMYTGQATWFSKEGTYLAFASFDDTEVDTYSYYYFVDKSDPDDLYPELVDLKYPKVGTKNPTVRLRYIDLRGLTANSVLQFVTLEAPAEVTEDHVLGGVTWPTDTEIAAHWLNRRQNYSVLRICNVVTQICQDEIQQQPNGWVPKELPTFSSDGSYYISTRWSMEQADGQVWQHLVMSLRIDDQIISSSITPGGFTVNNFIGMNEEKVAYYYTKTVEGQPWRSEVHVAGANRQCISCDLRMPDGGDCSWATATISTGGSYMSITCSSPNEPAAVFLVDPWERQQLLIWEDNAIVRERLIPKVRPQSLIFTVPLENGLPASVRLHLPPSLNMDDPNTKYPLIFYVYSGPGTNTVYDTFTVGYHSYLATSRNFIYMVADGRGSGLGGQERLYAINNKLGTVEILDHIDILKKVQERYSFIDEERIGIFGTSYGGYATLLTLIKDDENLFKCGIAGASVTSWLYYDTMYTERYMGLPTADDNLAGYEEGDVNLLYEKLHDKDFLLMHGNADDNVHYQNTAKLMKALQEADIPFQQMSYPDEAHSLAGVPRHRYNLMDRYWTQCFHL